MLGLLQAAPSWGRTRKALTELGGQYLELLADAGAQMLALMAATLVAILAWNLFARRLRKDGTEPEHTRWEKALEALVVLGAIAAGLWFVAERASLVDDAYISFRYSRNFAEGHGLVFNLDERVEGYTNFLWTFGIGLLVKLTPAGAPALGLWGSVLCFVANLVVVWRIGRDLAESYSPGFVFPLATALLAVQLTYTVFGTTGLETGCASLMVNLGALFLIRCPADGSGYHHAWAGLFLILATLTRPDHALFYAVGSSVVFAAHVRGVWQARRDGLRAIWTGGLRPMVLYAAPFLIYAIYLVWKIQFYGDILPNTYYAKSASLTYYQQGVIYMAIWHLASQLWIAIPLLGLWLMLPSPGDATRRFKGFAVPSVLLYEIYVMKVGGDFMHGRFYVTLMPLMLLGCGQLVLHLGSAWRRRGESLPAPARGLRWPALIVAPLLAATAGELPFHKDKDQLYYVVQEANFYPLVDVAPITVDHTNFRTGNKLDELREQGFELVVATSGIGMLGYNSQIEVIDLVGLTDAHVAHQKLEKRGRPGHEKRADKDYIIERNPHLVRAHYMPKDRRKLTKIRLGEGSGGRWYIWRYDRELMRQIHEYDPTVKFRDFERYLDGYIRGLPRKSRRMVLRDLKWFKAYYFNHNDDQERLEKIQAWLIETKGKPEPKRGRKRPALRSKPRDTAPVKIDAVEPKPKPAN